MGSLIPTNVNSDKIENLLAGIPKPELLRDVESYAHKHDLGDALPHLRKGALVTQGPGEFKSIDELDEDDREVLRTEREHRWRHSKSLYYTTFLNSLSAAIQGWDQTGSNGANLSFPQAFNIGDYGEACAVAGTYETNSWIVGAINGVPYMADVPPRSSPAQLTEAPETRYGPAGNQQLDETSPAEWGNAEDYVFDESQDFDNTTDSMGSLMTEPGKVGYTGALAKPRDGSWLLLYNIVIATGAFVGVTDTSDSDVPFYKKGRQSLTMDILEKGTLSYVQGLVLTANYLQKRNNPNSGFVLIGIGWSMALATGLHREFSLPSSNSFMMEIRRSAWWTLFVFASGAQLTLGRPPTSLVGFNVRPPSNLNDQDLAVDMESPPDSRHGPSTTACLVQHAKLAQIANMVQVELLAHQIPGHDRAVTLDRSITQWRRDPPPPYFDKSIMLATWFEIPKRILIWRSFHLHIILNRPILLRIIRDKGTLDRSVEPISACLDLAEQCDESICAYLQKEPEHIRGLGWYATYCLITATFVQATCYIYDPAHTLAPTWKSHLKRAVDCLSNLGATNSMAFRAEIS
ncbi:Zn(II)2Cys6 transcription factor [Fusarium mundagurra]|uniref:Zn(II)2Cys6 transcription factor n=1 Tax=Fusarium mundagurra TaxID=1567541 RepID=A0A8H6CYT3_9HYPO|nr:Zn(II)2Cys6 transcription factor [Fusarium mundagurra]